LWVPAFKFTLSLPYLHWVCEHHHHECQHSSLRYPPVLTLRVWTPPSWVPAFKFTLSLPYLHGVCEHHQQRSFSFPFLVFFTLVWFFSLTNVGSDNNAQPAWFFPLVWGAKATIPYQPSKVYHVIPSIPFHWYHSIPFLWYHSIPWYHSILFLWSGAQRLPFQPSIGFHTNRMPYQSSIGYHTNPA